MNFEKLWVIASDVYRKTVKSPSFLIGVFMPFIVVLVGFLIGAIIDKGQETTTIGIYSKQPVLAKALAKQKLPALKLKQVDSVKEAQRQLQAEKLDNYLVVTRKDGELLSTVYGEKVPDDATMANLQQALNSLQTSLKAGEYKLTSDQVAELMQPAKLEGKELFFTDDGKVKTSNDSSGVKFALSYAACIFTFFLVLTYASLIAQEIAGEKGMRIMEVILSSTNAKTHFYGKLLGVILAALTQLVATGFLLGVAVFIMRDNGSLNEMLANLNFTGIEPSFIILLLLFILAGSLFYAVLAALCGSLVSRAEDAPKAIMPVTYLMMAGYMLGLIVATNDPSNFIVTICSYIPFFSMILMPIVLANGAGLMGASISLVILVFSTLVLAAFSARMYRVNVLVYNQKGIWASLRQSLTMLRKDV